MLQGGLRVTVEGVRVPGARLRVVCVGPPDAPPVLVAHAGPGEAHEVLRPHFDRLASATRQVVYWDQRGGGASSLTAEDAAGGWLDHVGDIEALRHHLGVERFDLVGFSWGALLAALYALEHRGRVGALALVSPALPRGVPDGASSPPRPAGSLRDRFVARVASSLVDPSLVDALTAVDVNEDAARAVWRSLVGVDLAARLAGLRGQRALVLHGADDPVAGRGATSLASHIGAGCEAFARCGHAPFVEAPGPFFARLGAFLDGA